ncbi:MAG: exopolysaccharide biosynthesis polyprenyl glycosylphosphotransferase [Phenylobacterium sp.]|uniref:exopolysaccharide biosynthesis polyprenyl glycosylphosphotransferase n=1 Tax=Phenylobacterium sp. TaxID=1871053 RepID=UPI001A5E109D|nr:exopolysaccharide biosynthesis polyprenyl glycosylphosphotransferase [Phenylobacterium sp.]MBL8772700.1 exopolysaccharide biosynthesis polyprenyl glycosylphosphotransferase [Phenylobacterium sp.]
MADDTGAFRAVPETQDAAPVHRRGPLRPAQLHSVRSRISGAGLARLFQAGDVAALMAASSVATLLTRLPEVMWLGAPMLALFLLVATGAYSMNARERARRRFGRLLLAAAAAGGGAGALYAAFDPAFPMIACTIWVAAAATALCVSHIAWRAVVRTLRRKGHITPNLIIVGGTSAAQRLIRRALRTRDVNILGIFDDRRDRVGPEVAGVPVLGKTADLIDHRILPFVDRIVITVPPKASGRIAELLERLAPIPNPISLLLDDADDETEAQAVGRVADFDLAHISGTPEKSGYLAAKRVLDLTLSVMGLIALAPLMLAVAVAIKLDSPGPVFFRQRRHGYMNEEFLVWKFRSMRVEATDHKAARQVTADDDRVTRVGRFIRKTSLDELPQIFNIITGEMSIVGPRPHAIGMLSGGAEASKLVETYAHRHRIKPGLTGWAAVNGSRGPVDTPEDVRRRVALDLEYVERRSFWLDVAIILRTAPCLLGDSGAVR